MTKGYRKEAAGEGTHARAQARSWARVLVSRMLSDFPNANEFSVKLIVTKKSPLTIDVEVTVV